MNNLSPKVIYQIALTQIKGIGDVSARNLLKIFGSEEAIFKSSYKELAQIKGISPKLAYEILNPEIFDRAEEEIAFIRKNKIKTLFINDKSYPSKLKECHDAPILLYTKGNIDLDKQKIISIVGTRNASNYGKDFCNSFLEDIAYRDKDILIVSGLAYGIDIHAHRSALRNNLSTIGVLAHGLDRIYPSVHRPTAIEMLDNGGLITEFLSNTEPDKFNFVRRNRIVAGIADAIIVVESDERGGSLITAEIANSYCKDVFAVPGKINDSHSKGCNKLISSHKADLFASTDYFLEQMGWAENNQKQKALFQKELFIHLNSEEQSIIDNLSTKQSLHLDYISEQVGIPSSRLSKMLLDLEIKGIVRNQPGNTYALLDT